MKITRVVPLLFLSLAASAAESEQPAATLAAFNGSPIASPTPPYPQVDLRQCIGGEAVFEFSVLESGDVGEVRIVSAPSRNLARSILATVKAEWRFAPYASGGSGPVWLRNTIDFDPGQICKELEGS
jgi:TonB family protein